jgi:hypothetical protein
MLPISGEVTCFIFKDGIEPLWEHPSNVQGGKWVVSWTTSAISFEELMSKWKELVISISSGNFGYYNEIVSSNSNY